MIMKMISGRIRMIISKNRRSYCATPC